MTDLFNMEEICSIGIEIERNGEQFYRKAAEQSQDATLKKLFLELSEWENQHITLFENIRTQTSKDKPYGHPIDPDGEEGRYLKAIADSHIFIGKPDIPALVKACPTPDAILDKAIQFEKDSVTLYSALKAHVTDALGSLDVERLIQEEVLHVALLVRKKAALRNQ
ncbi:MAG: hypothetical protein A2293_01700 [Elusimicrobia bacterium RIFOXYB2_FULL_49_7]|nr:MAG: hypothetical protein A2293_01700 [Elusimicrobia bacterium RIFOXYB2_FULL_49_7]